MVAASLEPALSESLLLRLRNAGILSYGQERILMPEPRRKCVAPLSGTPQASSERETENNLELQKYPARACPRNVHCRVKPLLGVLSTRALVTGFRGPERPSSRMPPDSSSGQDLA